MNNKLKELDEALNKILDEIEPKPLIKAEVKYKPVMLSVKCGTNTELVKLFTKDFGITEKQIDDLIKKYLNDALSKLISELSNLMIKWIKNKYPDVKVIKEVVEKKIMEDEE